MNTPEYRESLEAMFARQLSRSPIRKSRHSLQVSEMMGLDRFLMEGYVLKTIRAPNEPYRLLEFGTGTSSLFFRDWIRHKRPETVEAWGADHSWKWLARVLFELTLEGLSTEHLYHLETFGELLGEEEGRARVGRFDFIFLDSGPTYEARAGLVPRCFDLLAPGGVIFIDDWNHRDMRRAGEAFLGRVGPISIYPGDAYGVFTHWGRYPLVCFRLEDAPRWRGFLNTQRDRDRDLGEEPKWITARREGEE